MHAAHRIFWAQMLTLTDRQGIGPAQTIEELGDAWASIPRLTNADHHRPVSVSTQGGKRSMKVRCKVQCLLIASYRQVRLYR
jgi:hypothetical protein